MIHITTLYIIVAIVSSGLLSKVEPLSVKYGFDDKESEHNTEGRLITAEYDSFFMVTTYVPNAGRGRYWL